MLPYLNNDYFVSSCKKSENFNQSMVKKSQKTLFLGQFWPILAQNGPKNLPKKNLMLSYLKNYYFASSCKNQKILATLWRENYKKPYFWAKLGPFWPKTGQIFFSKKSGSVTL